MIKQPAPASWVVADPRSGGVFQGQVVVIAGAAGAIGGPLADAFAAAGAVVHAVDVDPDALAQRSAERPATPWAACVHDHTVDVANDQSIASFATDLDVVDVVVSSIALNDHVADVADMSASSLRSMLDANVVGPAALVFALADALRAGDRGSVVFMTSIHSSRSSRWAQYGTAKGALRKLTVDLAGLFAESGVRVNAVAPGWTVDAAGPPDDRLAPQHLLGGSTVPIEAIVHAVMFLADRERSPMTTGQELVVDGGALLYPRR